MKNREKKLQNYKIQNSKNHTKIIKCHERSHDFFVPICVNCVYCVNCTKFGQLILRIIIKNDATRCQILRLKCTKIVFGWGGAYSAPPDSLAGLKGPTSTGRGYGKEGKGKGRGEREGTGREGTPNILSHPQFQFSRNMPDHANDQTPAQLAINSDDNSSAAY